MNNVRCDVFIGTAQQTPPSTTTGEPCTTSSQLILVKRR